MNLKLCLNMNDKLNKNKSLYKWDIFVGWISVVGPSSTFQRDGNNVLCASGF